MNKAELILQDSDLCHLIYDTASHTHNLPIVYDVELNSFGLDGSGTAKRTPWSLLAEKPLLARLDRVANAGMLTMSS